MILDTNIAMAVKNSNGQYRVEELTIFELESMKNRFPCLYVKVNKGKEIFVEVKCLLCGEYHHYHYNVDELLRTNMVIGGCEQLALPIFFIGKNEKVIKKVAEHRQTTEKIYAMI